MRDSEQQKLDSMESLKIRIQALENENRLLKERMDEAGVSYADIVSDSEEAAAALYDPNQGTRIKKSDITDKVAGGFFMMLCRGRNDLYDLRHTNPKTGKNGYYTQCFNRWDRNCHIQKKDGVRCKDCELRAYKPVILSLIKAHMNGTDPNGNVDVAMIRSLKKKEGFHPMLKEYSQVYFDECHHAASDSAIEVLQEINAKYVYSVTATPKYRIHKELWKNDKNPVYLPRQGCGVRSISWYKFAEWGHNFPFSK